MDLYVEIGSCLASVLKTGLCLLGLISILKFLPFLLNHWREKDKSEVKNMQEKADLLKAIDSYKNRSVTISKQEEVL